MFGSTIWTVSVTRRKVGAPPAGIVWIGYCRSPPVIGKNGRQLHELIDSPSLICHAKDVDSKSALDQRYSGKLTRRHTNKNFSNRSRRKNWLLLGRNWKVLFTITRVWNRLIQRMCPCVGFRFSIVPLPLEIGWKGRQKNDLVIYRFFRKPKKTKGNNTHAIRSSRNYCVACYYKRFSPGCDARVWLTKFYQPKKRNKLKWGRDENWTILTTGVTKITFGRKMRMKMKTMWKKCMTKIWTMKQWKYFFHHQKDFGYGNEVDAPMDGDHRAFTKVWTSLSGVISGLGGGIGMLSSIACSCLRLL